MILSPEKKASNRAAFRAMSLGQKAEYIFAYYKLPLVLALVAVVAIGSVAQRLLTHKDAVLYVAYANVVPAEEADAALTTSFVTHMGASPRKSEVVAYHELYLTSDANAQSHQYAYASRLKLLASIDAEQLDVVLMNQESYDLLSASGYLLDLHDAWADDPSAQAAADPLLAANTIVLSDNKVEFDLGEADQYEAQTTEQVNALRVTSRSLRTGLPEEEAFYLGIIANTPRLETSLAYLQYALALD